MTVPGFPTGEEMREMLDLLEKMHDEAASAEETTEKSADNTPTEGPADEEEPQ